GGQAAHFAGQALPRARRADARRQVGRGRALSCGPLQGSRGMARQGHRRARVCGRLSAEGEAVAQREAAQGLETCRGGRLMSQRDSGYARKERDLYETPAWVTEALIPHLPRFPKLIWEPAAGSGKMLRVLHKVSEAFGTDIE